MKKILPLLTLLLVLPAISSFSQDSTKTKTEKEIKALICHKWKATHLEEGGQKSPATPDMAFDLSFKTDGTYIVTEEGKNYPGKWNYDHKAMTLSMSDIDGSQTLKIIKITSTEFVFGAKDDEGVNKKMFLKRTD